MDNLEYDPIICLDGKYKGRIGMLDDFDSIDDEEYGIVYFGDSLLCSKYYFIPIDYLSNSITMYDIVNRMNYLRQKIANGRNGRIDTTLLHELVFVKTLFYEKHIRTTALTRRGIKVFISHSSIDNGFASLLYADLEMAGCVPWLDDRCIFGGESIPAEIEKGIDESDFLLILLSKNSVASKWVSAEWESELCDENADGKIRVIPLLIEDCAVPRLLKRKKYIDFREDYLGGLQELLRSFENLMTKRNGQ